MCYDKGKMKITDRIFGILVTQYGAENHGVIKIEIVIIYLGVA